MLNQLLMQPYLFSFHFVSFQHILMFLNYNTHSPCLLISLVLCFFVTNLSGKNNLSEHKILFSDDYYIYLWEKVLFKTNWSCEISTFSLLGQICDVINHTLLVNHACNSQG